MAERLKLVDLRRQYGPLREEILAALDTVLTEMNLNLGPNTRGFEQEWAEFCGTKHAKGVDNGTDALQLAMYAYGITAGDEVITPVNTFVAVVEAILAVGATPVFVDINPDTYNMDIEQTRAAITDRTRMIVPVHLYGMAADMDPILALAKPKGIIVLEDCSQAQGAQYKGKRVGGIGDAAAFSLYYTKNLGGFGEAGIFTTNDDAIALKVDMMRQHGANPATRYKHEILGFNSRLDEMQAAILRIKFRHLEEYNAKRRHWAARYTELLGDAVVTPKRFPGYEEVNYVYVIRTPNRHEVKAKLLEADIETGIHYPIPLHLLPVTEHLGYKAGQFPISEQYAQQILSLPLFPELTDGEVERVADAVKSAVRDLAPAR
ncbi:MAG: DegT/DnrJ/EryC1/StrS family aminotransferase [Ktedonobacterales bacterium]|nr:DegT/DnrJ/EryC1/StrS family aminotransferase [Ktedonobacterales bacterium]